MARTIKPNEIRIQKFPDGLWEVRWQIDESNSKTNLTDTKREAIKLAKFWKGDNKKIKIRIVH